MTSIYSSGSGGRIPGTSTSSLPVYQYAAPRQMVPVQMPNPQVTHLPNVQMSQFQQMPQGPHMHQMSHIPHMHPMQNRPQIAYVPAVGSMQQMTYMAPSGPIGCMGQMQMQQGIEFSRILTEDDPWQEKLSTHYVSKPIKILLDDLLKLHAHTKNDKVVIEYYNTVYGKQQPKYTTGSYDSGFGGSNFSLQELMDQEASLTQMYNNYCGLERFYGSRARSTSFELNRVRNEIHSKKNIENKTSVSKSESLVSDKSKASDISDVKNIKTRKEQPEEEIKTQQSGELTGDIRSDSKQEQEKECKKVDKKEVKETIATRIARDGKKSHPYRVRAKTSQVTSDSTDDDFQSLQLKKKESTPPSNVKRKISKHQQQEQKDLDLDLNAIKIEGDDTESAEIRRDSVKKAFHFWKVSEEALISENKIKEGKGADFKQNKELIDETEDYVEVTGKEETENLPTVQEIEPDITQSDNPKTASSSQFISVMTSEGPKVIMSDEHGLREDVEKVESDSKKENLAFALQQTVQTHANLLMESDSSVPSPGVIGGDFMTDDECLGAVGGEILRQQWSTAVDEDIPRSKCPNQEPIGTPNTFEFALKRYLL